LCTNNIDILTKKQAKQACYNPIPSNVKQKYIKKVVVLTSIMWTLFKPFKGNIYSISPL